ncbi:hypothetical protein ACU8OG_20860 [Rhizobium leguminosarum]
MDSLLLFLGDILSNLLSGNSSKSVFMRWVERTVVAVFDHANHSRAVSNVRQLMSGIRASGTALHRMVNSIPNTGLFHAVRSGTPHTKELI